MPRRSSEPGTRSLRGTLPILLLLGALSAASAQVAIKFGGQPPSRDLPVTLPRGEAAVVAPSASLEGDELTPVRAACAPPRRADPRRPATPGP